MQKNPITLILIVQLLLFWNFLFFFFSFFFLFQGIVFYFCEILTLHEKEGYFEP